jgi:transposase
LLQVLGSLLEQVWLCGEVVRLVARCAAAGATCPACGCWSEALHSHYERHLADLPIAGRRVLVQLRVRRFRCKQPTCRRRTFVEQAAAVAERVIIARLPAEVAVFDPNCDNGLCVA